MQNAIENLKAAQARAFAIRPKVGGFPYLAEALRQAGIKKNIWHLPSCQSIYLTDLGPVLSQGAPLLTGDALVPAFKRDALVAVIDADKAGKTTFPEFLRGAWEAGVTSYEVDFEARTVDYRGIAGESYLEHYPSVFFIDTRLG